MEDIIVAPLVVGILFIGLPWLILHYMTRWKTAATLTREDENLLDELYDLARRLERTEGLACAAIVQSRARLNPASKSCWHDFGGACAMFDGDGSPMTQASAWMRAMASRT